MATNLTSSDVSAGSDILATDHNQRRTDIVLNAGDYEDSTGSANAYALAIDSSFSLAAGTVVKFKANFANTAAATLNVNTGGAVNIFKHGNEALAADDIKSGDIVVCIYDGTQWQMVSSSGVRVACGTGTYNGTATSGTVNDDDTITTGFLPAVIEIQFMIQGHAAATGTADYRKMVGIVIYEGTTQKGIMPINYNVGGGTDGSDVSAVLIGRAYFTDTTVPTVGTASGTSAVQLKLSVNSVSSTGFVIRRQKIADEVNSFVARADYLWKAWG